MGVGRYGIPVSGFHSITQRGSRVRCRVEETRNEKKNSISTSNHVLFVYHANMIALYRQEKPDCDMGPCFYFRPKVSRAWRSKVMCLPIMNLSA